MKHFPYDKSDPTNWPDCPDNQGPENQECQGCSKFKGCLLEKWTIWCSRCADSAVSKEGEICEFCEEEEMEEINEDDELWFEPEWCEDCSVSMPAQGMEYTFDYYVEDGVPYCEHCGRPL